MQRFLVINGTVKSKPDYPSIYSRLFLKSLKEAVEATERGDEQCSDIFKKIILFGVKRTNLKDEKKMDFDMLVSEFQIISNINFLVGYLTPKEFQTIFPIEKRFDGKKYGFKDYFFTKNLIKDLGEDEKIGEKSREFLWSYQNEEISDFIVNTMCIMSAIRRAEGQKGIMEEFLEENGVPTYTMYENEKGKKFLVNNSTGETMAVKKPRPRHLKVIADARYPN